MPTLTFETEKGEFKIRTAMHLDDGYCVELRYRVPTGVEGLDGIVSRRIGFGGTKPIHKRRRDEYFAAFNFTQAVEILDKGMKE